MRNEPPQPTALRYLHLGAFSGSALSLRDALRQRVPLQAVDLMPLSRAPVLLPSRAGAILEARRAGTDAPWTKTSTWSRGLQRHLDRRGLLDGGAPLLVVQTLPAFDLAPTVKYAIYTDRVGREGAAVGGVHSSRFTSTWLERETRFLRGAAGVLVMGPTTRQVLVEEYGVAPDRVQVVGAGPNVDLGPPAPPRARARRLLFVGTQWELKGGPTLLAAFAAMRRDHPDVTLTVVGSGPAEVPPRGVTVLGRLQHSQMRDVYEQADVVVMPTHMEAYGIALVEALQKGLPCVCSTVGNQPGIVGDAGLAVPPGDPEALRRALHQVVSNYTEYQRRARARGEELRSTQTWQGVADAVCEQFGIAV